MSLWTRLVEGLVRLLLRMTSGGCLYWTQTREQKQGRPGNEAMVVLNATAGCLMKIPGNSMIFCPWLQAQPWSRPVFVWYKVSTFNLLCPCFCQESTGRLLKTAGISVRDKELVKGPWKSFSVESQASLLHPLPCQGVVVIGYETVSYYNKEVQHAIDPPIIKVLSWCLFPFLFRSSPLLPPSLLPPLFTLSSFSLHSSISGVHHLVCGSDRCLSLSPGRCQWSSADAVCGFWGEDGRRRNSGYLHEDWSAWRGTD